MKNLQTGEESMTHHLTKIEESEIWRRICDPPPHEKWRIWILENNLRPTTSRKMEKNLRPTTPRNWRIWKLENSVKPITWPKKHENNLTTFIKNTLLPKNGTVNLIISYGYSVLDHKIRKEIDPPASEKMEMAHKSTLQKYWE